MSDITSIASNALANLSDARTSRVRSQTTNLADSGDNKIEKSAKEFESILLASWLEQAEKSFATVPGGDPNSETADPGKAQFQSYAMQAVANDMTRAGGIGLAAMISSHLRQLSTGAGATTPAENSSATDTGPSAAAEKM